MLGLRFRFLFAGECQGFSFHAFLSFPLRYNYRKERHQDLLT